MKRMEPTVFQQDNLGVISKTKKVQGFCKAKQIGIKYHVQLQDVQGKEIHVWCTPTQDNLGDPFTKNLIDENFERLLSALSLICENDTRIRAASFIERRLVCLQ